MNAPIYFISLLCLSYKDYDLLIHSFTFIISIQYVFIIIDLIIIICIILLNYYLFVCLFFQNILSTCHLFVKTTGSSQISDLWNGCSSLVIHLHTMKLNYSSLYLFPLSLFVGYSIHLNQVVYTLIYYSILLIYDTIIPSSYLQTSYIQLGEPTQKDKGLVISQPLPMNFPSI